MSKTPKISIEDVHKRFGSKVVLDGVDLSVADGESLVVIGGSGTGKSVLLKCALGLFKPESGRIRIDGEDVLAMSASERKQQMKKFGMLFQGAALFDSLPVWRNVAFGLMQAQGMKAAEAKEIAVDKLGRVGLTADVAELYPAELSGGMKKRVGLARAIAADPEIIFFDEPTTGLDPIMSDVINELIVESVKQLGATTVTITHDMASARRIADCIAMLHKGKIVWHGPKDKIDDSGNEYVDQFIHGRAEGPIQMAVKSA